MLPGRPYASSRDSEREGEGAGALIAHTLDGRIIFANQRFAEQQGIPLDQVTALGPWGWVVGRSPENIAQVVESIVSAGHLVFETRPPLKSGDPGPWEVESWSVQIGEVPAIVSISRDMRDHYEIARALEFRSLLLDQVSDAVICHTPEGRIVYANEVASRQRGYTRDEFMELTLEDILSEGRKPSVPGVQDQILSEGSAIFESEDVAKDGTLIPVEVHARLIEMDGEPVIVSIVRDITERKRAQAEIERLAFFDTLTGLPNRRLLMDRARMALTHARRTGENVALIFLDLDHLKRVNDQLGHGAGDRLLSSVGERLHRTVRAGDTVARLGGDEFVVLMPDVRDRAAVESVARKLISALRVPFEIGGHRVFGTASMGVALNDPPEIDAEQMLANADTAMYSVKAATRDGYALYTRERHSAILEDYDLESDLRAAIDEGQLELHYQPQVRLTDGRVVRVEALVRWNHPARGMLEPGRFMPMAEETGLILPVGEWVLRTACAQHRAWREAGLPEVRMAINLSYRQMAQPHLPHLIESVLAEFGMRPTDLVLEIAEMDIIRASEAMRRSLDSIHASGVQLTVDDFGRGYGAVGHLHGMPIDTLKVNRCAVPDADEATSGAVASAVVQLATGLSLETVISCVESEEQLRLALKSSCEGVQGFVFSRAMPADELPEILRNGFNVAR